MDYRTQYRSFINSYYLSEGIRITAGLTLPTIIGTYLHHENIGITMSIGAVCVTIVDSVGPVLHRKNAMLVCNVVIFITSLLTGFAVGSALATGILIAVFCFIFSMIGVYGTRAGSIGLAGLFVMVLNLTKHAGTEAIVLNAAYILCGGVWYMLLSLSLYSFRPYKVTQQALGDLMQTIGEYILYRTAFYAKDPNYDIIYSNLLDKQAEINDKQNLVRELLYKSRDFVKETTNTGRVTLLIFIEVNDFFERVLSLQLHHKIFHQYFDNTDILESFKNFLSLIAEELNETGIALKSGRTYGMNDRLQQAFLKLKQNFEEFRVKEISSDNVEGFIGLRALINASEDFVSRIHTIQQYTSYDLKEIKQDVRIQNYNQFVTHQDIDAKIFLDNFNWKSNTFRHALRVSFATVVGFVISTFLPFGHGYWILLTIIVILKPAYSITKKRNRDRLLGTLAGAGIGVIILMLVKDRQLMIICMIVLMILAYSFMRTRYLLFVTLMTPYILILLYLLNPNNFRELIVDRVIDTAIGSAIALIANILFSPEWAYQQFGEYLQKMLEANKNYFNDVSSFFTGRPVPINTYKLSRKEAYVALANISGALNKMTAEPKSKQKNAAAYHELVVLNYMMSSHTATLASFVFVKSPPTPVAEYQPVVHAVIANLDKTIEGLKIIRNEISLQPETENPGQSISSLPETENPGQSISSLSETENPGQSISSLSETENSGQSVLPDPEDPESYETGSHIILDKMNERIERMVKIRKQELERDTTETDIKTSLTVIKSINDQFNFIWKISEDLLKIIVKRKII
ncbi:MAG TPA: FUSC family membrane protein [Puia sp.]|nr:FUSC family membrane protein [Puia sp.]